MVVSCSGWNACYTVLGWWESSGNRGAFVVHCPHPALISGPLLVTAECWRVVAIAHIISTSPSKASCEISTYARLRMRLCESYGVVLALVHVVPHSQNGSVSSHPMREVARIAGCLLQTHHVSCPSVSLRPISAGGGSQTLPPWRSDASRPSLILNAMHRLADCNCRRCSCCARHVVRDGGACLGAMSAHRMTSAVLP